MGFTAVGWDAVKQRVMFEVVLAKFEQNEELADLLIGTGEKILVEASPYDDVWGAGMSALEILSGKEWDGENLLGVVLEKVRVVIGPTDDSGVASLTPEAETSREQRSKERGLDSDVEAMELGDAFEAYEGPERLFPPGSGASSVAARLASNDVLAAGYVPYGEGTAQDLTTHGRGGARTNRWSVKRARKPWRRRIGLGHAELAGERRRRRRVAPQEGRANHTTSTTEADVRRVRCVDRSWGKNEIRQESVRV